MALVDSTLETALFTIFSNMNNIKDNGDRYMAKNVALAIKNFVLTATVSTTDVGTVSGTSSYSGKGTGEQGCFVIDDSQLETDLFNAFTKENVTDEDIKNDMATSINDALSESNIISTSTSGKLTSPSGVVSDYSGTGKGTFSGAKTIISNKLSDTFAEMRKVKSGGNELFAKDLAEAIGDFIRNGTITVQLDTPITGTGVGSAA
jgi:hypothetical protein